MVSFPTIYPTFRATTWATAVNLSASWSARAACWSPKASTILHDVARRSLSARSPRPWLNLVKEAFERGRDEDASLDSSIVACRVVGPPRKGRFTGSILTLAQPLQSPVEKDIAIEEEMIEFKNSGPLCVRVPGLDTISMFELQSTKR